MDHTAIATFSFVFNHIAGITVRATSRDTGLFIQLSYQVIGLFSMKILLAIFGWNLDHLVYFQDVKKTCDIGNEGILMQYGQKI